MAEPSPAVRKQIERLREALIKEGDSKAASTLAALLTVADKNVDLAPSRVTQSRTRLAGETLTRNTPVPVDRETSAALADIIFPSETKQAPPLFNATITQAINTVLEEWANLDALSDVGLDPAKTCLIFGAPGTGKSRLAYWMASQLDLPIVIARIDGLVSSFLGTTARNMRNLFNFTNRYRCVLLLDEFDALAKLRDDPHEVGEIKRVVNALLQNLDARRDLGFTIGITNHPALLDVAVWRRFEVQLEIPAPDFPVRVDIARHFMPPVEVSEAYYRMIAWFTEGTTGAEIEALVRTFKKASAIRSDEPRWLLDALRQFATLNSKRIDPARRALIFGQNANLFHAMREDEELGFSYEDIGTIAGKDKSTVGRQIKGAERDAGENTAMTTHG